MKSVHKYDINNRIESQNIIGMNWGCIYKYKGNYRKVYYSTLNIQWNQIIKEEFINNKYEMISSLTLAKKLRVYCKYLNGKEIYSKIFNKNTTFATKTLLSIGSSSIQETIFTKDNKIEKNIQIITKQDGRESKN